MRRVLIVIVVFLLVGCGGSATPGTPTPAARNMLLSQMTGADWLTLSFDDRQAIVADVLKTQVRCPSRITANDVTIGVSQTAGTAAGRAQNMSQQLTALLARDGCVNA